MIGLLHQVLLASVSSGASYDSDAEAIFAVMASPPDATRKGHINTLVTALKTAGIWSKLDHFVVCANTAAADGLLDWKNPSTPWTAVNSPTFTSDRGYAGDGSTSYLVGPTNLSALTNYTQNSCHYAVWSRTSGAAASTSAFEIGTTGASSSARIILRDSASKIQAAIQSGGGTVSGTAGAMTDGSGFFLMTRADASTVNVYRNGSAVAGSPFAQTSAARTAAPPSFGRHNTTYSNRQWALLSLGADLTSEQSAYYSAVSAYLTAVGAA